jgi:hypothetical protein
MGRRLGKLKVVLETFWDDFITRRGQRLIVYTGAELRQASKQGSEGNHNDFCPCRAWSSRNHTSC